MSLKAFHLVFIAISVVLAAFLAAWAVEQYRGVHDPGYLAAAGGSLLGAAALATYAVSFQRKMRRL
jgi:uncharacterized membrane protein YadS